jgi:hypothetical protein
MATTSNLLQPTVDVLEAIEAKVKALKLSADYGAQPAFQTVGLFDVVDLEEALKEFIAARDRVCLVIFDGDDFNNDVKGTDLWSTQTRKIDFLVSDRVMGNDRRKALFGNKEHPGAIRLGDVLRDGMAGILLPNPKGIFLRPLGSESMTVSDAQQRNTPGRRGLVVHMDARGGLLTRDLGKSPIQ